MEKIKTITTKTRILEACPGQYWIKSQRGKSYELWDENEKLIRRVCKIPAKKVFWVIPESED